MILCTLRPWRLQPQVEVDDEFQSLLGDIDTPRDLLDVEKELLKIICVTNPLWTFRVLTGDDVCWKQDDKSGTITEVLAEDGKLASVDTVHIYLSLTLCLLSADPSFLIWFLF